MQATGMIRRVARHGLRSDAVERYGFETPSAFAMRWIARRIAKAAGFARTDPRPHTRLRSWTRHWTRSATRSGA